MASSGLPKAQNVGYIIPTKVRLFFCAVFFLFFPAGFARLKVPESCLKIWLPTASISWADMSSGCFVSYRYDLE